MNLLLKESGCGMQWFRDKRQKRDLIFRSWL